MKQDQANTNTQTSTQTSIAALTFELSVDATNRVQLLPVGEFVARDGRPASLGVDAKAWQLNELEADALIADAASRGTDYVIDYEHQTIYAEQNGQPAPAAGWFKALRYVAGVLGHPHLGGLFATDVRWTDKAKAMIKAGEYKYISPVFSFDTKTGAVTKLLHAALTNNPALDNMQAVSLAALRFNGFDAKNNPHTEPYPHLSPPPQGEGMTDILSTENVMKQINVALKLNPEADEASAVAALSSLQEAHEALAIEVAALRANQFDAAKHMPLEEYTKAAAELSALKAQVDEVEHATMLASAIAGDYIMPVNKDYWAKQSLAALREFLKDAKPVMPTGTQTGGKAPAGGNQTASLTADELATCKAMGVSSESFAKTKAAEAATAAAA